MLEIESLTKLVHELSKLPSIGPKTAQRLAYHILKSPETFSKALAQCLLDVKTQIHDCPICFNFTDQETCRYCSDLNRQNDLLCVVEEPQDIARIESSGVYRGRYHVLRGALSPLDGIHPKDLTIGELEQKVNECLKTSDPIREVILALDADLEGDTTSLYLQRLFQDKPVKLTRLAQGLPIGSDMDYIDERTIGRALENRVGF